MKGPFSRGRIRAAVGLIAAYAIALQTLFAAFAPLPASAKAGDFGQLSVICFGSGTGNAPSGDGETPAQHSGTFHCVLCGSALAGAAIEPNAAWVPASFAATAASYSLSNTEAPIAPLPARAGPSRAPPLTV